MAEDPAARKERLRKLREAAEAAGQGKEDAAADGAAADMAKPVLKFRNYQVHDAKHIQHEQVTKQIINLHMQQSACAKANTFGTLAAGCSSTSPPA
jgi:hypothetical protein